MDKNIEKKEEKIEEKKTKFKTPKVLPVLEDETDTRLTKYELHPHLPQLPSMILGIGSVMSGKTTLLNSMAFQSREDGFYDFQTLFDEVHIMSNTIHNDPSARFLKKAFNVYDGYSDGMITKLVDTQKEKGHKKDMAFFALIMDDILSKSMKRNSEISYFISRYRHYNCGLCALFVQNFKNVDTLIRNNATDIIIFKQTNIKQLMGIAEEYHAQYGSIENFLRIYEIATAEKYSFLYLKQREGKAYKSFEYQIAEGPKILVDNNISLKSNIKKEINKVEERKEKENNKLNEKEPEI